MNRGYGWMWIRGFEWGIIQTEQEWYDGIKENKSAIPIHAWTDKELEILATCDDKDRLHLATDYSMVHRGFRKKCMWEHTTTPCLRDKYE